MDIEVLQGHTAPAAGAEVLRWCVSLGGAGGTPSTPQHPHTKPGTMAQGPWSWLWGCAQLPGSGVWGQQDPSPFLAPPECAVGGSQALSYTTFVHIESRAVRAHPQAPGALSSAAVPMLSSGRAPSHEPGELSGHETPETSPVLPPGSDTSLENPEEKLLVSSPHFPALLWSPLAAEDPAVAASSCFGAELLAPLP